MTEQHMPIQSLRLRVTQLLRPVRLLAVACLLGLLAACGGGGGGSSPSPSSSAPPVVTLLPQNANNTVYPHASTPVTLIPYFSYGTGEISWVDDNKTQQTRPVTSGSSFSDSPGVSKPYTLTVKYQDPSSVRPNLLTATANYTVNVTALDTPLPALSFRLDDATTTIANNGSATLSANSSHKVQAVVSYDASKLAIVSTTMTFNGNAYSDVIADATLTNTLVNAPVMMIVKYKDIRVTDSAVGTVSAIMNLQTRTDTITQTSNMNTGRSGHIAIWLPTINKLLVAGGISDTTQTRLKSAELYDPMNNTWTKTGDMSTARLGHTATLLGQSGKVLVTGGTGTSSGSAEIYDTTSGKWTSTGSMASGRQYHTATELKDGNVFIAGGTVSDPAKASIVEIYKTASGSFVALDATKSLPSLFRSRHTATLLSDGVTVVLAGGAELFARQTYDVFKYATTSAGEPTASTWLSVNTNLKHARYDHTATLYSTTSGSTTTDKIVFIGGYTSAIEICTYDSTNGLTCADSGNLTESRGLHTSTYMPNTKKIAIIGGSSGASLLSSIEIYTPTNATANSVTTPGKSLNLGRAGHSATLLVNNKSVLITGSNLPPTGSTNYTNTTELYTEE